jgi:hypothetical protein
LLGIQESAPDVPLHATAYLNITEENDDVTKDEKVSDKHGATSVPSNHCKFLVALFAQPGAVGGFYDRIQKQKVVNLSWAFLSYCN